MLFKLFLVKMAYGKENVKTYLEEPIGWSINIALWTTKQIKNFGKVCLWITTGILLFHQVTAY